MLNRPRSVDRGRCFNRRGFPSFSLPQWQDRNRRGDSALGRNSTQKSYISPLNPGSAADEAMTGRLREITGDYADDASVPNFGLDYLDWLIRRNKVGLFNPGTRIGLINQRSACSIGLQSESNILIRAKFFFTTQKPCRRQQKRTLWRYTGSWWRHWQAGLYWAWQWWQLRRQWQQHWANASFYSPWRGEYKLIQCHRLVSW